MTSPTIAEAPERRLRTFIVSIAGPTAPGPCDHATLAEGRSHGHRVSDVQTVADAVIATKAVHPGATIYGTREA